MGSVPTSNLLIAKLLHVLHDYSRELLYMEFLDFTAFSLLELECELVALYKSGPPVTPSEIYHVGRIGYVLMEHGYMEYMANSCEIGGNASG